MISEKITILWHQAVRTCVYVATPLNANLPNGPPMNKDIDYRYYQTFLLFRLFHIFSGRHARLPMLAEHENTFQQVSSVVFYTSNFLSI